MEDFEWNVFNETKLFEAMVEHKPMHLTYTDVLGVNKYFQMALIWSKLQDDLDVSSDKIWAHLDTMYNLESLDEVDSLPFPNDEREFYLPDGEYGTLKQKKEEKVEDKKNNVVKKNEFKETPKVNKEAVKKDDKIPVKKETPRRDSKDGKEPKTPVNTAKKETRKEVEKPKPVKGKMTNKEDEKMKTPKVQAEDTTKRLNKRPTRGSMRPEEVGRKSQSPLTVTPPSVSKRRRV